MPTAVSQSLAACAALLLAFASITAITVIPEPAALSLNATIGQALPELA